MAHLQVEFTEDLLLEREAIRKDFKQKRKGGFEALRLNGVFINNG
ncbi:hypothetical protein [Methylotuvimicrobium sp.]